jgi:hypothetical protein
MNFTQMSRSDDQQDVVVYVDELLDEQNRLRLEHAMMNASGVKRAHFSNDMLVIGYDPAKTNSSKILKLVNKQRLNARLVCRI